MQVQYDVIIVGAGFTGLTAALSLVQSGHKVLILESDSAPGGLAGTFEFSDGVRMEKFYHHWFTNDDYVPKLVRELDMDEHILHFPSRTGMYYNGQFWRLSTPMDVLRFKALSLIDRIRLGLLVLRVRRIKDWKKIEHLSIREWLEPLCGKNVFRVVWEPLINSKFSVYADAVNAVWFWKKLVLRGSTRNKRGGEQLAYFKGGFGKLAEAMVDAICSAGGEIRYNAKVTNLQKSNDSITSVMVDNEQIKTKTLLLTPAFPIIADLFSNIAPINWVQQLRRVNYIGNICLVLQLDRSLSDTYWLNVNEPGFPFVGVIEHTNLDLMGDYNGAHIIYLSRYLATDDPVWCYNNEDYLNYSLPYLKRMFPDFSETWVLDYRIWRTPHAQAVTERDYSAYLPEQNTPFSNAWIATMAQIYPEDRGTNYAIREGKSIAKKISEALLKP